MKLHTPSLLLGALLTSCLVLGGLGLGSNSASAIAKPVAKDQIRPADLKRPSAAPAASYTTRGEVVALPEKGKPNTELMVKHQAIDDFKNKDGKVVGMSAMTMEFPPEKGIDVTILAIGDKVELEFAVWWAQSPPWLATKLTNGDGSARYDCRSEDHYHLRDVATGEIRDLPVEFDRQLLAKIDPQLIAKLSTEGFQVTGYRLEVLGRFSAAGSG